MSQIPNHYSPPPTPLCSLYQTWRIRSEKAEGNICNGNKSSEGQICTSTFGKNFFKFDAKLHINMYYVSRDMDSKEAKNKNQEMTTTLIIPFNEGGLLVHVAK